MQCPACATLLTMSERQGIEIDYCPTCRGVWLDRGELDKIIEKNAADQLAPPPQQQQPQQHRGEWREERHYSHDYGYRQKPYKRRKSFLEDLFD